MEVMNPYVDKSKIHGQGLFAGNPYQKGDMIGLSHINGMPANYIGEFHNHSTRPNAQSVKQGDRRFLVAKRSLKPNEEITVDYTKQPELEQPRDFQQGGKLKGYIPPSTGDLRANAGIPDSQKAKLNADQEFEGLPIYKDIASTKSLRNLFGLDPNYRNQDTVGYLATSRLLKESGAPSIKYINDFPNRSRFSPLSNNITLYRPNDVYHEVGHSLQNQNRNLAGRAIREWFDRPYFSQEGYDEQYDKPGNLEYEAEHILEPKIYKRYLQLRKQVNKERKDNRENDMSQYALPVKPKLQEGGNPYSRENLIEFLYEGDKKPEAEVVQQAAEQHIAEKVDERRQQDEMDEMLALQLSMDSGEEMDINELGNPYRSPSAGIVQQAGVNPYLQQTQQDVLKPGLTNLGIWGDKSHQARPSDHNTGDAQDFGVEDPKVAEQTIAQLQKEAKLRNIKYIIYNKRIWNPSISNEWRPYNGPNPHDKHFHVSYNR